MIDYFFLIVFCLFRQSRIIVHLVHDQCLFCRRWLGNCQDMSADSGTMLLTKFFEIFLGRFFF